MAGHRPPGSGVAGHVQETLPFELTADTPVPYVLTARARRAVAPGTVADLTLVDDQVDDQADDRAGDPAAGEIDDPRDTRPAQARALRRAGLSLHAIADRLAADPLAVRVWTGGRMPDEQPSTADRPDPTGAAGTAEVRDGTAGTGRNDDVSRLERTRARAAARARLASDPTFAAGLGLVVGIADVGPRAVVLATGDQDAARVALRWLRATTDLVPARIRVILRTGPRVAGDVGRHRWAEALDVPVTRVSHASWPHARNARAVEVLVRIADARIATTVSGWRDALLAGPGGHRTARSTATEPPVPSELDELDLAF